MLEHCVHLTCARSCLDNNLSVDFLLLFFLLFIFGLQVWFWLPFTYLSCWSSPWSKHVVAGFTRDCQLFWCYLSLSCFISRIVGFSNWCFAVKLGSLLFCRLALRINIAEMSLPLKLNCDTEIWLLIVSL